MMVEPSIRQNEGADDTPRNPHLEPTIGSKEGLLDPSASIPETSPSVWDWDGPDDVDNPHNWPLWKRVLHSAIPAIYGFAL